MSLCGRCEPTDDGIDDDAQPHDGYDDGRCWWRRQGEAALTTKFARTALAVLAGMAAAEEKKAEESSKVETLGPFCRRFGLPAPAVLFL